MPPQDRRVDPFQAGIEALLLFYAPDVVCYPAPGWVDVEVVHGHEGVRQLSGVWLENVDGAELKIHEVRDLGERIMILAEFSGRAKETGEPITQPFGVINSDLREDGKVGEVRFFLDWDEARRLAGL